jgi:ketopantoate reductase
MAGSEVTILGAGAIGSYLSDFLAPAQFILNTVDYKKVQSKHTCGGRTIYDPLQIGMRKGRCPGCR